MSIRWNSKWMIAAYAAFCAAITSTVLVFSFLQTNYIQKAIRDQIVATLSRAIGAPVSVGSFAFSFSNLTFTLGNLQIRGDEPSLDPALFSAQQVEAKLETKSLLRGKVEIASVVAVGPRFYVNVRADGSTNVPPSLLRSRLPKDLVQWGIHHFEFRGGQLQIASWSVPLNLVGNDVQFRISQVALLTYRASVSSKEFSFTAARIYRKPVALYLIATLRPNSLRLAELALSYEQSAVKVSGTIEDFSRPRIDLNLNAEIDTSELQEFSDQGRVQRGRISLEGILRSSPGRSPVFRGKAQGLGLTYRLKSVTVRDIDINSEIVASSGECTLTNLIVNMPLGRVMGGASWNRTSGMHFDGNVREIEIGPAVLLWTGKAIPWNGVVRGPILIDARHSKNGLDLSGEVNLQIQPSSNRIPVSGRIQASFSGSNGRITFGESDLSSPETRIGFSGTPLSTLSLNVKTSSTYELEAVLQFLVPSMGQIQLPMLRSTGTLVFNGELKNSLGEAMLQGGLSLSNFQLHKASWKGLTAEIVTTRSSIKLDSFSLSAGSSQINGRALAGLINWTITDLSPLRAQVQFKNIDLGIVPDFLRPVWAKDVKGVASGSATVSGTVRRPSGNAQLDISNFYASGQHLDRVQLAASATPTEVTIRYGRIDLGPRSALAFSGVYQYPVNGQLPGSIRLHFDGNNIALDSINAVQVSRPGLKGNLQIYTEISGRMLSSGFEPDSLNGRVLVQGLALNGTTYGDLSLVVGTVGGKINADLSGMFLKSRFSGRAEVSLKPGNPVEGNISFGSISLRTLDMVTRSIPPLPFNGQIGGDLTLKGKLSEPSRLRASFLVRTLILTANPAEIIGTQLGHVLTFKNRDPFSVDLEDGLANLHELQLTGEDTSLSLAGKIPYVSNKSVALEVNGRVDLRAINLLTSAVTTGGQCFVSATIRGTPQNPSVDGSLRFVNGTIYPKGNPGGFESINGNLSFNRDRATIQKLTARYGGGTISVGGFVTYSLSGISIYHLEASAQDVRVRYASSIGVTGNSSFRLSGTESSSLLSGNITISHAVFNPSADVGNLLAAVTGREAILPSDRKLLNQLHLDLQVQSSPDLQLSTSLSRDLQAAIDLRVRGTAANPVLLGSISANQGDIRVFGTRYTLNRGQVTFVNSTRIDPVLDLDLQTQTRGITVGISASGTLGKLNVNYRSDPPLQPRDILALLTLGRAPGTFASVESPQAKNDIAALQSGATSVLGQAVAPPSNRLSKLFGITNVKIDPLVQGITNTPQARLTLEQQISRDVTVTYVTNLSQTSEQVFRLEWALNNQYSIVALRDDNGEFGIDFQYKKRFK